jgi:predicted XRE-type DNA-binding protein
MTKHRNWKDVRAERIKTPADEARIAALKAELMAEIRAYRLAEVRKHQGLTQRDIAEALHVSQARISKMEQGDLQRTELSTIRRYVEALGGTIEIVASFGDQRVILT